MCFGCRLWSTESFLTWCDKIKDSIDVRENEDDSEDDNHGDIDFDSELPGFDLSGVGLEEDVAHTPTRPVNNQP